MVNLSGGLRGLGVALSTIGTQGMAEQQRVAADQRMLDRETAFARIQQTIRNADLDTQVDRGVDEIKVQTPHLAAKEDALLATRQPYVEESEDRADRRQVAREGRDNSESDRRAERDFQRWRQQHAITEDSARSRELWRREQGLDEAPVRYLENGETGTYVAVGRNNEQTDTGIQYRSRASDDNDDDDSGGGGFGSGAARSATRGNRGRLSPRGVSSSGDQPPIPGARRAEDGNWYTQRGGRWYRVDR